MKVLSLFDGISCARVALERAGVEVEQYFASENDTYAIQIASKNWPDIMHVGGVEDVAWEKGVIINTKIAEGWDVYDGKIDLLIGGSPCQDLSIAKKGREGLKGEKSKLFWEYVRILKEVKPKYFILENVASMSKESKDIITNVLEVEPIMINAALVSAQQRKRLFWTNIPGVGQPEDREIYLKDIILDGETEDLKSLCVTAQYRKTTPHSYQEKKKGQMIRIGDIGSKAQAHRVYSIKGKSVALSALGGGQGAKTGLYLTQRPRGKNLGGNYETKSPTLTSSSFEHNNHLTDGEILRRLHPIECERLQSLPDNYTEGVSNSQRYKMLGNAFNVEVITHILKHINHERD